MVPRNSMFLLQSDLRFDKFVSTFVFYRSNNSSLETCRRTILLESSNAQRAHRPSWSTSKFPCKPTVSIFFIQKDHLNDDWIQPIIMGYLNECHFEINEQIDIHLVLISRRNRHRAGVRMHCRGIDNQGNVANYVETEQVSSKKIKRSKLKFD